MEYDVGIISTSNAKFLNIFCNKPAQRIIYFRKSLKSSNQTLETNTASLNDKKETKSGNLSFNNLAA